MARYLLKRIAIMVGTIVVLSFISFVIIDLPPGSYLDQYVGKLRMAGNVVDEAMVTNLVRRYGLDQPFLGRYFKWVSDIVRYGDFGRSFGYVRPVINLILGRLPYTVIISLITILFTFTVSFFVGIYSAIRQYTIGDGIVTVLGFLGLAIPNFLFALVLMYVLFTVFGVDPGGLFSQQFVNAPWSFAKLVDLLKHLIVPVIVIGTGGTAGGIRTMRAVLLDELHKEYVDTARMKGVSETALLFRYPVRIAVNPMLSTIGWLLPVIISGDAIVSIVLNLPTLGPLLLESLQNKDMYLAGSIVLFQSSLTVLGTFISDLLLAWSDPRIRYG
jgi:peptide/nickel transport system permease protein